MCRRKCRSSCISNLEKESLLLQEGTGTALLLVVELNCLKNAQNRVFFGMKKQIVATYKRNRGSLRCFGGDIAKMCITYSVKQCCGRVDFKNRGKERKKAFVFRAGGRKLDRKKVSVALAFEGSGHGVLAKWRSFCVVFKQHSSSTERSRSQATQIHLHVHKLAQETTDANNKSEA